MDDVLPLDDALAVDVFFQRDAVDVFHDDVLDHVAEADVVHLDDVRMRQHGDRLGFILETAAEFLVVEIFILENFDGYLAVVQGIGTAVDVCHAADADQLMDLVASVETFANILIHLRTPFLNKSRSR